MSNNITTIPPLFPTCVTWRIHWDKIDKGVNWVAVDSMGSVYAYSIMPKKLNTLFTVSWGYSAFLFKIEERPDWHTLIFSRPK